MFEKYSLMKHMILGKEVQRDIPLRLWLQTSLELRLTIRQDSRIGPHEVLPEGLATWM